MESHNINDKYERMMDEFYRHGSQYIILEGDGSFVLTGEKYLGSNLPMSFLYDPHGLFSKIHAFAGLAGLAIVDEINADDTFVMRLESRRHHKDCGIGLCGICNTVFECHDKWFKELQFPLPKEGGENEY